VRVNEPCLPSCWRSLLEPSLLAKLASRFYLPLRAGSFAGKPRSNKMGSRLRESVRLKTVGPRHAPHP
jgi:hypothetical protein